MAAGDLIRLAWEAEHDGRARLRDALMTLAIAESTPDDPWAERCRARLVLERPDHYLARFATVSLALQDPRVVEATERLRVKYPESRVQSLLLRARAARGPYLGRVESLEAMIDDLAGPTAAEAENVRRDAAQPTRGPTRVAKAGRSVALALAYPPMTAGWEPSPARYRQRTLFVGGDETVSEPPLEDVPTYYLTVLLAIAFLLASVEPSSEGGTRRG
jgi:hypothetical protein